MNRYNSLKILNFKRNNYLIMVAFDKIIILTSELLEQIQVIFA
jgi:hypothetical protein